MHFGLSEEQEELTFAIRTLVERREGHVDLRAVTGTERGYDPGLWATLCEQIGVAALAIPEHYGGAGFSAFETHLVLETLGMSLTPTPLLGSAVLATQAILLAGSAESCQRLLPGLAEGGVAALAWADQRARWRPDGSDIRATESNGQWCLDGVATLVLDAEHSDLLLAVATTQAGPCLFEVPRSEGVRCSATPSLDVTLRPSRIEFTRAPALPLGTPLSRELATLYAVAATAITALQVGGAQGGLRHTIEHLMERQQFGRPLGSFQALKHRIADLFVAVETSRSVSWSAAWAAAHHDPDLLFKASVAKSWCSDSFNQVSAEMVQMHGGIAITWEHDAHLYFKRAHATAHLFGSAREHRRRLIGG